MTESLSSLTAATTYYVDILAYNIYSNGPKLAAELTFTTSDIPATPAKPTVAQSGTDVTITFAAPADNGSPITSYQVLFKKPDSSYAQYTSLCDGSTLVGSEGTGCTVAISDLLSSTGNTVGTEIVAAIIAVNGDGASSRSPDSDDGVLYQDSPASAPTLSSATATSTSAVTVAWTDMTDASTAAGYNAITKYKVEYRVTGSGSAGWAVSGETADGDTVSYSVTGLTTLTNYDFRVSAYNAFGYGPANNDASVVSTRTQGVPFAPAKPTLTQASGSQNIVVNFAAPTDNGGAAIDTYKIEVRGQDGTTYVDMTSDCTETINSAATACTVTMTEIKTAMNTGTAPSAGDQIKFRITAHNTHGYGSASAVNVDTIVI